MENNKKFNKLSVVSFILILVGPLLLILDKFNIYLPQTSIWGIYVVVISLILGFILSIISLFKIKRSPEKGKWFAISTIAIFIIAIIIFIYSSLDTLSDRGTPSNAIKANVANMRAQAELYYSSSGNESFTDVCSAVDGFGGVNGQGMLSKIIELSKGEVKCFSDADSYVVSAKYHTNDLYNYDVYFCIDSLGSNEDLTTVQNDSIINADTLCPIMGNY